MYIVQNFAKWKTQIWVVFFVHLKNIKYSYQNISSRINFLFLKSEVLGSLNLWQKGPKY